jgi:tetratricopeptide (TPR) repeat protein
MKRFLLFCLSATLVASFSISVSAQGKNEAAKLTKEGSEALKRKDYDKAVEAYQKAAELDHRNDKGYSLALQQRAYALTAQQKFQQAIEDYNSALEITPDDQGIYERRAYAEMRLGDYNHALTDYNEMLKRKPNDVSYLLYRSYIYEVKGDIANSMADCDKVLQMHPNAQQSQEVKARKERLTKIQQNQLPAGPITPPPKQSASPATQPKKP